MKNEKKRGFNVRKIKEKIRKNEKRKGDSTLKKRKKSKKLTN